MTCAACSQLPQAQRPVGCQACLFTTVDSVLGRTLIDSLAPTVDCARDLFTSLGVRSYQVNLVWTRWSGGERGVGQEYVAATQTVLPTPKLAGLGGVQIELKELGSNEQGSIELSQISLSYSEDLLLGRGGVVPEGESIPFDVSFFWELALPIGGGQSIRRRFTPSAPPERRGGSLDWLVRLVETEGARRRDGGIDG